MSPRTNFTKFRSTILCLFIFLLMSGPLVLPIHRSAGSSHPNVIVIVVDTLRADHMSTYGYFRKTTPQIDALARESVVFKNAVSHAPWTTPSIASLFTSQNPAALGFDGEDPVQLDPSFVTLAEVFKDNRYITQAIVSHDFIGTKLKFDRGFDSFDQSNAKGYGSISSPAVTGAAVSFVERHRQDGFFLFLHYFDPHFDYILHPEFNYDPGYQGPIQSGEFKDSLLAQAPTMTEKDRDHLKALYDSEVSFTDQYIGRFLDELKRLGLYDRSLIVLTADHGEEFSERGDHWVGHSKKLYQDLIHVPLIIKLPNTTDPRLDSRDKAPWKEGTERSDGWKETPSKGFLPRVTGRTVEEDVGLIDVMPTIVAYLGLKTPRSFRCEGRTIDLRGSAAPAPRPIFSETRRMAKLQSVVWMGWKLIYDIRQDVQELYDLNGDPGETRNVAATHPKECAEMRAFLWSWRAEMAEIRSGLKIESRKPEFNDIEKARLRSLGYIK
jgi:arylsulfatase A-like enzyme